ncbi:uracil-DNA glycosylase, partial [Pseudomonas aeruginosa]
KVIFPPGPLFFNAPNTTPLENVKVLIIGQDPYHGPGQAHGLCFSVQPGVPTPSSFQNLYKELTRDLNFPIPNSGYLQRWAAQGVLLLNTSLTVEQAKAGSHANAGWQPFTDRVIEVDNERCERLVFLLWAS